MSQLETEQIWQFVRIKRTLFNKQSSRHILAPVQIGYCEELVRWGIGQLGDIILISSILFLQ